MSKLIVTEFVSLNGVIEAPGGEPGYAHSGWTIAMVVIPRLDVERVALGSEEGRP